jgi:autotransporter-associated beta strand protein
LIYDKAKLSDFSAIFAGGWECSESKLDADNKTLATSINIHSQPQILMNSPKTIIKIMKTPITRLLFAAALLVAAPAALQAQTNIFWDTSTAAGVQNGNGTWGTDNFWTTTGTTLTAWTGLKADSAFFGGNTGFAPTPAGNFTVTVSGTQQVNTIWQQDTSVGNFTLTGGSLNANAIRIDGGNMTVDSLLVDNGGTSISFTARTGASTVTLGGNNTFTQNVTIAGNADGGGKILLNHQNALGSGTTVTFNNGAHLDLNGYSISGKDIVNNRRGGLFNTGATDAVWSGNVSLADVATRIFTAGGTGGEVEISGVISGSSLHAVRAIDNSVLRLSGNNTYAGDTILRQGSTLIAGHANALGSTSGVNIDTNATLDLNGFDVGNKAVTLQTATSKLLNSNTSNAANLSGNISILLNQATSQIGGDGDLTLGGVISSAVTGGFTKVGNGTLTLTNTNTYTGNTTVSAGTLLIDGSTAAASAVSVSAGAVIGGNGTISGNLTLATGALFAFDAGNTLTLGGSSTFALDSTFGVASLRTITGAALDWDSIGVGEYTLITGGNLGPNFFDATNISNFGLTNALTGLGTGGDKSAYFDNGSLKLVVVPEPATYALLGGLLALGLVLLRRRVR